MTVLLDEMLLDKELLEEELIEELVEEEWGDEELVDEELLAKRRQIIASKTKEDWAALMKEVTERSCWESSDEFIRQSTERYKQSDRYKEYLKRRQAEQGKE